MAYNQTERHNLGREGEEVVNGLVGGRKTCHKAPFDVVDFNMGIAYEVKTMSGLSKDLKIHISDPSMARKLTFVREYGLKMVLMAVVIYSPDKVEVYKRELVQCVRISQMTRVQ